MDVLIRYWNADVSMVETRYLKSEFMGGAKAEQILETFESGIAKLKAEELLQLSSDGPNVNLKFLQLHTEKQSLLNFCLF